MTAPRLCGVYHPRHMGSPVDVTGCLLPDGHLDSDHECDTEFHGRIAWATDWTCTCPDCRQGDDTNHWCTLYRPALSTGPRGPA